MFTKHKIYGKIFNIFRSFPLKSNKVCFLTDKKGLFEANFNYIAKELDNRNNKLSSDDEKFEYHYVPKDEISFKNMYNLATSKYVFLADNFFPIAFMNFHKDAIITQLWHACGTFKQFGYDFVDDEHKKLLLKIGERVNYLLVSSSNIADIYAHAFGMDVSKTLPFGCPKLDYYSKEVMSLENKNKIRDKYKSKYPEIGDKKIVLYAPTFRETSKYNNVFDYFDFKSFTRELGDEYILFIRLHPKMSLFSDTDFDGILADACSDENIINVADIKDEEELLLVSDVLITDYSSMMAEYALLHRPTVFFAYDLDNYIKNERDFYIDFIEDVPGNVVYNMNELISLFKNNNFDLSRVDKYLNHQLEYIDDKSTSRIVDFLFNKDNS
ncbi:MAG: CDP-glycerol glycerophosphotransferase family protein [Methanobacteriaceae archaeon]|nr:CDP-glycerol glycerophosphotransferase family protein [Methanobacteriaceae archaeon]